MNTVRRLYFYVVTLISAEVVIWGVINLLRTLIDVVPGGGTVNELSTGLSMILVGTPIFLLHWVVCQRDARRDVEERDTRLRAVFLYAMLAATLIPAVQNVLALINRPLMAFVGQDTSRAWIGAQQSLPDNLAAIAINLVAWFYFLRILGGEWLANLPSGYLAEVRRLYRYVWVVYGLGLMVTGVQQLISYLFMTGDGSLSMIGAMVGNGLTLMLVGVPLWAYTSMSVHRTLVVESERRSLLRLVMLYAITLVSLLVALGAGLSFLTALFNWLLGEVHGAGEFFSNNSNSLALVIVAGVLWVYYGRLLHLAWAAEPDLNRRASLSRLYDYILSLLGTAAVWAGLWQLTGALIDLSMGGYLPLQVRGSVAAGLALLAEGVPLWLIPWPRLQTAAHHMDDPADHARRSLVRKAYLYLLLFVTVVGAMASAGAVLFLLLNQVLGNPNDDFARELLRRLDVLVLVGVWLGYHLAVLIWDGRLAHLALGRRHANFPALLVAAGESSFGVELQQALQRQAPQLPFFIHQVDEIPLDASLTAASVVLIPASLALDPPEGLRQWLKNYSGQRMVVSMPAEGWTWLGTQGRSLREQARETAAAVRQMAEGQPVKVAATAGAWVIAGYVLASLFGLQLLLGIFSIVMALASQ
jgi:hypothetical protein